LVALYRREHIHLSHKINPTILYFVAQTYSYLGEYQNTLATLLEINPYDLEPHLRGSYIMTLADAYLKEGLAEKALEKLENHHEDPLINAEDRQELTLRLADIYRHRGDLLKAFDCYQSVIKNKKGLSDGKIAQAYLYSGSISNQQKKPDHAESYLNHCIALIEKDGDQRINLSLAYIELGNSHYERSQYSRAMGCYQQGLALGYGEDHPDYWNIRYRLAMSYLETGEGEKAEPHFREIADEGDPVLQQRVQVKLGMLALERQLNRLSIVRNRGIAIEP